MSKKLEKLGSICGILNYNMKNHTEDGRYRDLKQRKTTRVDIITNFYFSSSLKFYFVSLNSAIVFTLRDDPCA